MQSKIHSEKKFLTSIEEVTESLWWTSMKRHCMTHMTQCPDGLTLNAGVGEELILETPSISIRGDVSILSKCAATDSLGQLRVDLSSVDCLMWERSWLDRDIGASGSGDSPQWKWLWTGDRTGLGVAPRQNLCFFLRFNNFSWSSTSLT